MSALAAGQVLGKSRNGKRLPLQRLRVPIKCEMSCTADVNRYRKGIGTYPRR